MTEHEFSGPMSVVSREPDAGDYEPRLWIMRSVATIGIILATAGLVLMPLGLTRLHEGAIAGDPRVHMFDVRTESPSLDVIWMCLSSCFEIGLALLLLAGSIGALRLRSWSRSTLILWAVCSLVVFVVGCPFNLSWWMSSQRAEFAQVRGVVDAMASFAGWGLGSGLAIAMLVVLTRPNVHAAFKRDGEIICSSPSGKRVVKKSDF